MIKKISKIVLSGLVSLSIFVGQPVKAEDTKVLLLIDSSGSMLEPTQDGKTKIETLKEVATSFVKGVSKIDLGMRVYSGLRFYPDEASQCVDTRLLNPIGPIDKEGIIKNIQNLYPNSKTPLAYSIQKAIGDFPTSASKKIMIVLTDGLETCNGDPCAAAKEAAEAGIEVHVIGFGLDDASAKILECIPQNANGKYFGANNAEQLKESFKEVTKIANIDFGEYTKCINWDLGAIVATGSGVPPQKGSPAQKRLMAKKAATSDAYRQITECVMGVKVDSQTTVRDFVTQNDEIKIQVNGLIKGAKEKDCKYNEDGTTEVTLEIPVSALIQILGKDIQKDLN